MALCIIQVSREQNPYDGIIFVCGREEFAVSAPIDGKRNRNIGHFADLEDAVAFRKNYLEQHGSERRNREQRRRTESGESTTKAKKEEI
jgi:hypothetical protein